MTTSQKLWPDFGTPDGPAGSGLRGNHRPCRVLRRQAGETPNARNRSATTRQLEINTSAYVVNVRAFLRTGAPQTRQGAVANAANVETALQRTPTPNSDNVAFGCVYVMEGATLGGRVIGRRVRQTLGATPETGGRFHAAYGARTEAQRNEIHG